MDKVVVVKWGNIIDGIPYYLFSLIPLFFAYFFIFDKNSKVLGIIGIIPLIIAILFITVGITKSFNTTEFRLVSNGYLVTKSRPIAIGGKIYIKATNVQLFEAKRYSIGLGSSSTSYYLTVVYNDGVRKKIPNIVMSREAAEKYSEVLNKTLLDK